MDKHYNTLINNIPITTLDSSKIAHLYMLQLYNSKITILNEYYRDTYTRIITGILIM